MGVQNRAEVNSCILQAFFNSEYLAKEPDDGPLVLTMKHLVLSQVPLIAECLRVSCSF